MSNEINIGVKNIVGELDTTGKSMSIPQLEKYNPSNLNFVIGNPEASATFFFSFEQFGEGLQNIQFGKRNEELLLKAVRNYIRKINFAELNEELEDGSITEEDYNNELEKNSDKYAITLKSLENPGDIDNIIYLTDKIGYNLRNFSVSEVSEMFSVNEPSLLSRFKIEVYKVK